MGCIYITVSGQNDSALFMNSWYWCIKSWPILLFHLCFKLNKVNIGAKLFYLIDITVFIICIILDKNMGLRLLDFLVNLGLLLRSSTFWFHTVDKFFVVKYKLQIALPFRLTNASKCSDIQLWKVCPFR